ncbi:hypothetical protein ACIBCN_21690 [Nocardia sp. NPDC051052]|uniref:hypothetical protein n=1 Tax=Nocardia sp. NPDC051052 TaxID=3364322 RepID=UPI00379DBF15
MVGNFFQELAKKLAERWAVLLMLPGALFVMIAWAGSRLGQRHALDWSRLNGIVSTTAASISRQSPGTQAVLVVAVLLAATGAGAATQALAGWTRLIWLGQWPRVLAPWQRWRIRRRRHRWHGHVQRRQRLEQAAPRPTRTTEQQDAIDVAAGRANRIAMAEPGRPTWMGDRIHAVERVALNRYGLDLPFTWPRLWLVLPDATRTEIATTHGAFAAAVATGTWAWPYLFLGIRWWPAILIGVVVSLVGRAHGRSAVADLTTLSESALDLHARLLAKALGVAGEQSTGPLTLTEGFEVTALVRKGR